MSRDGQGRIGLSLGPRLVPNGGFLSDARATGETIPGGGYGLAPAGLASFGYWLEDSLELSIEGGYSRDQYGVTGSAPWLLNGETIMASMRWAPWTNFDIWPYGGASFGYSLNSLTGPLNSTEEADGYGGALFVGTGWDLSERWGISLELRYTIASIIVPNLTHPFDVGGLSLLIGAYFIVPREPDSAAMPSE